MKLLTITLATALAGLTLGGISYCILATLVDTSPS